MNYTHPCRGSTFLKLTKQVEHVQPECFYLRMWKAFFSPILTFVGAGRPADLHCTLCSVGSSRSLEWSKGMLVPLPESKPQAGLWGCSDLWQWNSWCKSNGLGPHSLGMGVRMRPDSRDPHSTPSSGWPIQLGQCGGGFPAQWRGIPGPTTVSKLESEIWRGSL